jgi:hypothetical protein
MACTVFGTKSTHYKKGRPFQSRLEASTQEKSLKISTILILVIPGGIIAPAPAGYAQQVARRPANS